MCMLLEAKFFLSPPHPIDSVAGRLRILFYGGRTGQDDVDPRRSAARLGQALGTARWNWEWRRSADVDNNK